jgi:hypothetical protein
VPAGVEPPLDQNGQPVPDCDMAPADVKETTMFASAIPGDVAKRSLAPDDKQALCDIYPVAMDPKVCPTTSTPPPNMDGALGCAVAAGGSGGALGAALAALGAFMVASRRRGARGR